MARGVFGAVTSGFSFFSVSAAFAKYSCLVTRYLFSGSYTNMSGYLDPVALGAAHRGVPRQPGAPSNMSVALRCQVRNQIIPLGSERVHAWLPRRWASSYFCLDAWPLFDITGRYLSYCTALVLGSQEARCCGCSLCPWACRMILAVFSLWCPRV